MINYYYIIVFLSVICSVIYVYMWHKHLDISFAIVFTLAPISCIGFAMYASSMTIEEAVLATKVLYLGGSFLQYIIMLSVFNLCQIDISRWIRTVLFVFCVLLYASVLSIGYSDLFYKDMSFRIENGLGLLERSYGPAHSVFYVFIIVFFVISIAAIVFTYLTSRQVPRKVVLLLLVPEVVCILSYILEKVLDLPVELIPAAYLIAEIMYILIAYKVNMYNVSDTAVESLTKEGGSGFVTFDFRMRYLGSNAAAKSILPDLDLFIPDEQPQENSKLGRSVLGWLRSFAADETQDTFSYTVKGRKATADAGAVIQGKAAVVAGADIQGKAAADAGADRQRKAAVDAGADSHSKAAADAGAVIQRKAASDAGADEQRKAAAGPGADEQDRIYNVEVKYLYGSDKKRGYMLVFTDDTERRRYIDLLGSFNDDLKKEVEAKTRHIVEMHDNLIMSLAMMVESRDNSTGGHIMRTSEGVRILMDEIMKDGGIRYSAALYDDIGVDTVGAASANIGRRIGSGSDGEERIIEFSDEFCHDIIKAAPMHDLGKIAVDDAVLKKPGRFTPEEYEKMKKHPEEGARVIHKILINTDDELFRKVAEKVAHYHHERWDGSGYPCGLKGVEIPIESRIMAIADVYDALVSKRVYKERMSFESADSIIMEGMGTQFDPALKKYYIAARPRLEAYYSSLDSEQA